MDVSVELTDEGVAHVDDVIRTIYHYIHMLRYGRTDITPHSQPGRQAGSDDDLLLVWWCGGQP